MSKQTLYKDNIPPLIETVKEMIQDLEQEVDEWGSLPSN